MSKAPVKFVSLALKRHQEQEEKKKALEEKKKEEEKARLELLYRPSAELDRQPVACFISRSVSRETKENCKIVSNLRKVSIEDNLIFDMMVKGLPSKPQVGDRYMIIVDESRYGIQVIADDNEKTRFFQHFLHYEESQTRLNAVNYRQVAIFWRDTKNAQGEQLDLSIGYK